MGKCVYHYCSIPAFMAIIQNSTIRLTNITQSNDKDEIINAIDEYCDILKTELIKFECKKALKSMISSNQIDEIVEKAIRNQSLIYYAACFSESKDLLSQWRGYGNDGDGVAIGFDSSVLENNNYPCVLKFDRVHYGQSAGKNGIETAIANAFNMLIKKSNVSDCDIINVVFKVINLMVYNAVFSKKEAFVEEGEWRLVFYPFGRIRNLQTSYSGNTFLENRDFYDRMYDVGTSSLNLGKTEIGQIGFYERKKNIISYFDFNFSKIKGELITEIIVGPKAQLNENDLKLFLAHNGLDMSSFRIYKSALGYR